MGGMQHRMNIDQRFFPVLAKSHPIQSQSCQEEAVPGVPMENLFQGLYGCINDVSQVLGGRLDIISIKDGSDHGNAVTFALYDNLVDV